MIWAWTSTGLYTFIPSSRARIFNQQFLHLSTACQMQLHSMPSMTDLIHLFMALLPRQNQPCFAPCSACFKFSARGASPNCARCPFRELINPVHITESLASSSYLFSFFCLRISRNMNPCHRPSFPFLLSQRQRAEGGKGGRRRRKEEVPASNGQGGRTLNIFLLFYFYQSRFCCGEKATARQANRCRCPIAR